MSSHTVIWSASTCKHPGAGVYLGLAPQREHMIVARALSRRQAKVFVGGRVRGPGENRPWQIYYYAVRDPSAVRVVPINGAANGRGFGAAELRFRLPPAADEAVAAPGPVCRQEAGDPAPAAFLMTIGLGSGEDRIFFQHTIGAGDRTWSEVFELVLERACGDQAA